MIGAVLQHLIALIRAGLVGQAVIANAGTFAADAKLTRLTG